MQFTRKLTVDEDTNFDRFPFDVQHAHVTLVAPLGVLLKDLHGGPHCEDATAPHWLRASVRDEVCVVSFKQSVSEDVYMKDWNQGWTLLRTTVLHGNADDGSEQLDLGLDMQRNYDLALWTLFLPSVFVVVLSWSGFYIAPSALMPRFASGLISFLALQTFRSYVAGMIPSGVGKVTWIDNYISFIGCLTGLAVVENVTAQYLNENYSVQFAHKLDSLSRRLFPGTFVLGLVIMGLAAPEDGWLDVDEIQAIVHYLLIFMAISPMIWVGRSIYIFQHSILMREVNKAVRMKRRASRTSLQEGVSGTTTKALASTLLQVTLDASECKSLFNHIDHDRSVSVSAEEIFEWVCGVIKVDPKQRDRLRLALYEQFPALIGPDEFKKAFITIIHVCSGFNHPDDADAAEASKQENRVAPDDMTTDDGAVEDRHEMSSPVTVLAAPPASSSTTQVSSSVEGYYAQDSNGTSRPQTDSTLNEELRAYAREHVICADDDHPATDEHLTLDAFAIEAVNRHYETQCCHKKKTRGKEIGL